MHKQATCWIAAALCVSITPFTHRASKAETPKPSAGHHVERYEFEQVQMGVRFKIALYARCKATANKAAESAFKRIKHLNDVMSDYDSHSELMRLCRSAKPGEPVKVSRDLSFVLGRSLELSKRTAGAFDVTVGPLVKLWRRARRRKQLPSADRLAAARNVVGYKFVRLDSQSLTVALLKPDMRLDLGGIAKGHAADEALAELRRHGISRALIDGSGDIVVGDPPPGKPGWSIQIAPLQAAANAASRNLLLCNCAVATSGDAYQFLEIGGKRYSHILDPHTGLGLTDRSSVTVIAPDGVTADSLASAVSVLGPERGLKLIEQSKGTAALIAIIDNEKPMVFESSRLRAFEAE